MGTEPLSPTIFMKEELEKKIKCNNCGYKTTFTRSDFDNDNDADDVYCSDECRYNFETGNPGTEY